jgi:ribosomal protein S18 acetylase RimI-like enzyme
MAISIREAKPKDAAAIARLILELATTLGEHSPISEAYAGRYLSTSTGAILLAESQERVIGLLSYSMRPDLYHAASTCLIEELVVEEGTRGQGVGSLLLTELLSRLATMDCPEVSVSTMPENTEAIKFYRKHGLIDQAILLERHFKLQHRADKGG